MQLNNYIISNSIELLKSIEIIINEFICYRIIDYKKLLNYNL